MTTPTSLTLIMLRITGLDCDRYFNISYIILISYIIRRLHDRFRSRKSIFITEKKKTCQDGANDGDEENSGRES